MGRNFIFAIALAAMTVTAASTAAQERITVIEPVRTDSPRQTLQSFLTLTQELEAALREYQTNRTGAVRDRVAQIGEEFLSLIDLSSLPESSRRERGVDTGAFLLDIFGRIDMPELEDVPGADAFDDDPGKPAKWQIPNTPIEITRIKDGPQAGEFQFGGRTLTAAPRFYEQIRTLPLKSSLPIKSWSGTLHQLTGPLIPAGLVLALPDSLKGSQFGTPVWKIIAAFALIGFAVLVLVTFHRIATLRLPTDGLFRLLRRLPTPIAALIVAWTVRSFVTYELNVAGDFAAAFDSALTLLNHLAFVWLFWLVVLAIGELIIRSPRIPQQSLDASLVRLCSRVVGVVGAVVILASAGNALGLPVYSMIAGLGIGGLAVALAVRPTLENLIGGLILYADRPVRVGDFCRFNDFLGTVERIGVRSTQIRALDRTMISVPNSRFADMEIINWAKCDQMLIDATIGLRYETESDQLRYVLATLREMFYAHPKIDNETVRVRFSNYGESSLDISIRVYARTREWNEFYAIQEDVLLRVNEIVRASGTGFAFPSQTLYVRRDQGLDGARSNAAVESVKAWRRSGHLPFPQPPSERIDQLEGTLDYPPRGSPGASFPERIETESLERLSAEAEPEAVDERKPPL